LNTRKQIERPVTRFVALFPNRSLLKPFEAYRQELFAGGFLGAWSFPLVVPLASVARPFSKLELKELCLALRALADGKRMLAGKSFSSGNYAVSRLGNFSFWGPRLDIQLEKNSFGTEAQKKIIEAASPPVLVLALNSCNQTLPETNAVAPPFSLSSAALANISIRPLFANTSKSSSNAYSFEWKISPLVWLPKY
jgi:hypothetical protein